MTATNDEQDLGHFYGVGLGPGDPDLLTLRAAKILRNVDVIFHVAGPRSGHSISRMIVTTIEGSDDKSEELVFSMSTNERVRREKVQDAAERVCAVLREGRDCAFATIGDPLIYSTFSYLQREVCRRLPEIAVTVVPGVTAYQAAAADWGKPLAEDNDVLTVVPRWQSDKRRLHALAAADTVVCLKTYRDRAEVFDALRSTLAPEEMLYAARVGHRDEVLETDPEKISALPVDYLSLLVARRHSVDG